MRYVFFSLLDTFGTRHFLYIILHKKYSIFLTHILASSVMFSFTTWATIIRSSVTPKLFGEYRLSLHYTVMTFKNSSLRGVTVEALEVLMCRPTLLGFSKVPTIES